jgi:hypothetical protein
MDVLVSKRTAFWFEILSAFDTTHGCTAVLQELHTSAQEASGAAGTTTSTTSAPAAAAGRTKPPTRSTAAADVSKAKEQAVLVAAADALLTCAVIGALTRNQQPLLMPPAAAAAVAGGKSEGGVDATAAATTAATLNGMPTAARAALAAAVRAGVIPELHVEGAVAPPLTPNEQLRWLRLAARAFQRADWKLQAGQVLLGLGPESWGQAKKLLKSSGDQAAVAAMFEEVARQELGLGARRTSDQGSTVATAAGSTTAGTWEDAADGAASTPSAVGEAGRLGGGLMPFGNAGGSFLSASRLLREAFSQYAAAHEYEECWRMLQSYEGLRPLLPRKGVDDIILVRRCLSDSSVLIISDK